MQGGRQREIERQGGGRKEGRRKGEEWLDKREGYVVENAVADTWRSSSRRRRR